jgi:hypothetical protein
MGPMIAETDTKPAPLEPVFAKEWPETRDRRAVVLCEGASLWDGWMHPYRGCPVVAVNRAIAIARDFPVDVWATLDHPANLWEWAQEYLHPATKLFTGDDKAIVWQRMLGPEILQRLYAWPCTAMEELEDEDGLAPLIPTLFHVLPWLLSVGVREVDLLGADFSGTSSPLLEDFSITSDEGHALRWNVERAMLSLTMKQYRARGARIKRWTLSKTRRP